MGLYNNSGYNTNNTGWWFFAIPLKNMSSSVGIIVPNIWKNKKWSKPPTSITMG
jgi:hypothetical protein